MQRSVGTHEKAKGRADQGLNEKQLREKGERKIKADELQPVGEQREQIKSCIIGIVQSRGNEAHGQTHDVDDCAEPIHMRSSVQAQFVKYVLNSR